MDHTVKCLSEVTDIALPYRRIHEQRKVDTVPESNVIPVYGNALQESPATQFRAGSLETPLIKHGVMKMRIHLPTVAVPDR
jgi:hypothetical protein